MKPDRLTGWIVRLCRLASICGILAILILSWMPASARPETGVNNLIEHCFAYAVTAFVTALAFVPPRTIRAVLAGMILLAGIAEFGQNFAPGRDPKMIDSLAGTLGASGAVAAFAAVRRRG